MKKCKFLLLLVFHTSIMFASINRDTCDSVYKSNVLLLWKTNRTFREECKSNNIQIVVKDSNKNKSIAANTRFIPARFATSITFTQGYLDSLVNENDNFFVYLSKANLIHEIYICKVDDKWRYYFNTYFEDDEQKIKEVTQIFSSAIIKHPEYPTKLGKVINNGAYEFLKSNDYKDVFIIIYNNIVVKSPHNFWFKDSGNYYFFNDRDNKIYTREEYNQWDLTGCWKFLKK